MATRFGFTARHAGKYYGTAPTGEETDFTFMSLCRMSAGRIVECWVEFDSQTFRQQLGIGAGTEVGEGT